MRARSIRGFRVCVCSDEISYGPIAKKVVRKSFLKLLV